MIQKIIIGLSVLSTITYSCSSNENNEQLKSTRVENEVVTQKNESVIAGLLVNNCYSCHSPNATHDNRIAPPMSHVKEHYIGSYKTKEEFVKAMTSYVNEPNVENAIMTGAINKFGVMPNMQFAKTDVDKIVEYLYTTTIDTDEWLAKYGSAKAPEIDKGDYLALGRHIVMSTKKQLGKNLKKTIKTKGTKEAVSFCNINAMPILDSMALVHDAKIYRVSNKPRNSNNVSNLEETAMIVNYQTQLDNGEELNPILNETNDLATFYMPIVTNDMCMKCHGSADKIEKSTLAEINRLYPKDMALDYSPKQIRGVWRIEMKK